MCEIDKLFVGRDAEDNGLEGEEGGVGHQFSLHEVAAAGVPGREAHSQENHRAVAAQIDHLSV